MQKHIAAVVFLLLFAPFAVYASDEYERWARLSSPDYPSYSSHESSVDSADTPADVEEPTEAVEPEEPVEPWVSYRDLLPRRYGVNLFGVLPVLLPAFGDAYEDINVYLDELELLIIHEARHSRARSITFSYVIHETDYIISIVVNANVSSVIPHTLIRSVNFTPDTGEIITLRDVMDADISSLAMRMLMDRMRRSPEHFSAVPSVIIDNQAFFVNNVGTTILFDEFQLSTIVSGYFPLQIKHSRLSTIVLPADRAYHPSGNSYNLVMVPIRYVAEGLGYEVRWFEDTETVVVGHDLHGEEPQHIAWMRIGVNAFHTSDTVHHTLEASPRRSELGSTYVPITFFERILPLSVYSRDSYGNIKFLSYIE